MQKIFVGDIQGCADEFDELLERARAEFGGDFEIWSVGDLINRGPDNLRVLTRMRDLVESGRGTVVLGNHELGLLLVYAGLRKLRRTDTYGDVLDARDGEGWIEWLRTRPLAVTGRLGTGGDDSPVADGEGAAVRRFAMVHASVHPDWDLAELERRVRRAETRLSDPHAAGWRAFLGARDDPDHETLERLVRCRSVMISGVFSDGRSWSSRPPESQAEPAPVAWHRAWAARRHDYGIVYGHWAQQGLHVEENLRGLDTGCVHHGRGREGALTAWLPDPSERAPFATPDDHFWHIPARRAYYAEKLAVAG